MRQIPGIWAISDEGYSRLAALHAEHEARVAAGQVNHVAYWSDGDMDGDRESEPPYKITGGVAHIPIRGPLFATADMWTWLCGGMTYDSITAAIGEALADPQVGSIVLDVDSPGGVASGCDEAAAYIRAATGRKPLDAHAVGSCTSAAYWLAIAARSVKANSGSPLGSIGVRCDLYDDRKMLERIGVERHTVVAEISPRKAIDFDAEDGLADVQALVSDLGEAFVASVVRYRNTSRERVLAEYGKGAVVSARAALAAGMIDAIADPTAAAQIESMPHPAREYAIGDRVRVVGKPHMAGHVEGTVKETPGEQALGIDFDDGMGTHRWYLASEVEPAGASAQQTSTTPRPAAPMTQAPGAVAEAHPQEADMPTPQAPGAASDAAGIDINALAAQLGCDPTAEAIAGAVAKAQANAARAEADAARAQAQAEAKDAALGELRAAVSDLKADAADRTKREQKAEFVAMLDRHQKGTTPRLQPGKRAEMQANYDKWAAKLGHADALAQVESVILAMEPGPMKRAQVIADPKATARDIQDIAAQAEALVNEGKFKTRWDAMQALAEQNPDAASRWRAPKEVQ